MNRMPVLKSKLIMPELPGNFLLTNRIEKLHQEMDHCKAVTVCAPAGYGKTTLAASYFRFQSASPFRVCWYRLDPADNSPSVFITYLAEAIFPAEAAEFTDSRKALKELSEAQLQPYHVSMLCHEMWSQYSRDRNTRTYIVLDDFQNAAPECYDMVRYLLDNLPPACAIFILSRSCHPVFSEKQKLERQVLDIHMEDLAFRESEIGDLMASMGQQEAMSFTGVIEKTTEGWIAGILIFYQAFKNKGFQNAAVKNGKLGHEDALFRYLSYEVIKSIDTDTQHALARLSLLHDFTEAEAAAILEIHDINSFMQKCLGFGMFIQRIPGNPVVYRYHALFREFLLVLLKSLYNKEQVTDYYMKSAQYYIQQASYVRAAEYLTKCGDSAAALEMVTKVGFNKLMVGETGQLKLWLDLFPEEMIRGNPVLLMYKAQLMPNSRQNEMVDTLKMVLRTALRENHLEVWFQAASILIYIFICSNRMEDLLNITQDIPNSPNSPEPLKNILAMMEMVHFIARDEFTNALEKSESIVSSAIPEDSRWLFYILSCIVYYSLGRLEPAQRAIQAALDLEGFKNVEPARGFSLLFLTTVQTMKKETQVLQKQLAEVMAIGEKYSYEYLAGNARRLSACERYLSHDAPASVEMMDYAVFYFRQMNNRAMAAACRLLRCLWSTGQGNPEQLLTEARGDFEIVTKSKPGMMLAEISLSILGAIAREAGDYAFSEQCFLEAMHEAAAKNGLQILCGTLFHTARLNFIKGDCELGRQYLSRAMELASGNHYCMFWDIHMPTLIEMNLRSIRYGYCAPYAQELLGKFYSSKTVMYLSEKVKNMDEGQITGFVDQFVRSSREDSARQLYLVKASLFGKTEISVNGIKIPDAEWKTKKVKSFLEYLLLNSGTTVSKEFLAESLWPDSDSKSAAASQRTALYYLRKVLSAYHAEVSGSNAFIYETLEGLQIRKNEALELDVHEFLQLSAVLADSSNPGEKQINLMERMIAVYKGDLMDGSDYEELYFHERERLKSIFMEACRKLGEIYLQRAEMQKAEETLQRALAAEPVNENICLNLLELYKLQGRKSKAVKLYYRFKKQFEQELEIQIDKRLTEVIRNMKKT